LSHQKSDESPDQLSDLDEHEQHDDRQDPGDGVVMPFQQRHAYQVAHVCLPEVKPDDHPDGAGDPDDDERQPRDSRCRRAAVFGPHELHHPDRENADAVTDRTGRAADDPLEERPARQQRRGHRQP
jgi:hypothetical protein